MKGFLVEYTPGCTSQLFGEAEFPELWLEKDVFSPCEFFLCKIDLSVFGGGLLGNCGYLYVFIDMPSSIKKVKPVLRFWLDEPDACTDFNDGFFDYELDAAGISVDCNGADDEIIINEETENDVVIISLGAENLPEELSVDRLSVVIDKQSLLNGEYVRAKLVF